LAAREVARRSVTLPADEPVPLRIGISSCLLGQQVRYDAGHKHDRYITDVLGPHVVFVPVCPELEVGMGVPREPVHLEGQTERPRMVRTNTREDWTERMEAHAQRRARQLARLELSGYLLKKGSPSCGMERVKVVAEKGPVLKQGRGIFARVLMERLPELPVEEEGRLHDLGLREHFLVRVFARHRLLNLFRGRWTLARLVRFHAAHKLLLMAHSQRHLKEMGQLVAAGRQLAPAELRRRYEQLFMAALDERATTRKHVNVLQHMMGYLRDRLDDGARHDLLATIEDYRQELVPLIVPLTLLRHYVDQLGIAYLQDQIYLRPHPRELKLRNHV
jgi:uncharacterized protein YbgA (DUF1722 family)/uncharacterized protein YbbK (DUF523 family)